MDVNKLPSEDNKQKHARKASSTKAEGSESLENKVGIYGEKVTVSGYD